MQIVKITSKVENKKKVWEIDYLEAGKVFTAKVTDLKSLIDVATRLYMSTRALEAKLMRAS